MTIKITHPVESDGPQILAITAKIILFSPEEKICVKELWEEFQEKGAKLSGYEWLIAHDEISVLGYACFGPRSLTVGTYDLYWIAVDPLRKRQGVGRILLQQVELEIRAQGGRLLVVETSGLEKYAPTRLFYLGNDYKQEAVIKDFYEPGDDLVIFTKHL